MRRVYRLFAPTHVKVHFIYFTTTSHSLFRAYSSPTQFSSSHYRHNSPSLLCFLPRPFKRT